MPIIINNAHNEEVSDGIDTPLFAAVMTAKAFAMTLILVVTTLLIACSDYRARPTEVGNDSVLLYAPMNVNLDKLRDRKFVSSSYPFALPQRGVMISSGSFVGPEATFEIVDFDSKTISQIRTYNEAGVLRERSHATKPINFDQLNNFIRQASELWAPPKFNPPTSFRLRSDATCDVILFDHEHQWIDSCLGSSNEAIVRSIRESLL